MPGRKGIRARLPSGLLDLEQVAGAEILDRDDRAERRAGGASSQGSPIRSA